MGHETPEDLAYTNEHEWAKVEDGRARIGITDFAQDQLTDIVYVELPSKGDTVSRGDAFAVLESVKSVSDVYAPLEGTIVDVNHELVDSPELVNEDPYGDGWIIVLEMDDENQVKELMDPAAYMEHTEA